MGNKFKKEVPTAEKIKKSRNFRIRIPTPKDSSSGSILDIILNGTFLTHKGAMKLLPLFLFITFLALIYIANNYWAIKSYREISIIKKELKELRFEHITTKSEFMFRSKQSEVAKRLDTLGIKESTIPPQKFVIKSNID